MMKNDKERILEHSGDLFLREGFHKTSMDDIAVRLKISKKTIYKYFSSKDELIRESLMNFMNLNQQNILRIAGTDANAVEKFFEIFSYISRMLMIISESFLMDIRSYKPDLWNEIDRVRTKVINAHLKSVIEQGQKEGLFVNTPSEVLVTIFVISIRGVLNPDSLISNKLSPSKTVESIIEILMNGILTENGRQFYNKLKSGEV